MDNELELPVIDIGGSQIAQEISSDLVSLIVEQSLQVPDKFTMRFLDPRFDYFDSDTFTIGDDVEVSFTTGDAVERLGGGVITSISIESGVTGISELVVAGLGYGSPLPGGLRPRKEQAKKASGSKLEWPDSLYSFDMRFSASEAIGDSGETELLANSLARQAVGEQVDARGVALGNPLLRPGSEVEINGLGTKLSGKYVLTSVDHLYQAGEQYVTRFRAGSGGEPGDLNDHDQAGRGKANLRTLGDDFPSDWARNSSLGAGVSLLADDTTKFRVGEDAMALDASTPLRILGKDLISIVGDDEITITADAKGITIRGAAITIEATNDLTLSGTNVSIKGEADVTIEGATTNVRANGVLSVQAGGIAKVKGSMVQLG